MSNTPIKLGRRHFLAGVGGFALAVPYLTSLEKGASASAASSGHAAPRYFYLGTDHGGCWDSNFFPTTTMSQSTTVVPGHTASAGALRAQVTGGKAALSPVLTASSAALTPGLVAKMNVLRGLDVPWYIAHNTGQHLGNFARNDNNGSEGATVTGLGSRPTIDQIMAASPSFYGATSLASTKLKTMVINSGRTLSYAFSNPSMGVASGVQNVQGLDSSLQLFNSIFGGASGPASVARPPVVDKVLGSYNSLLQSNARLSAADKLRLQTHIAMIAQLQSSLNAQLACAAPPTPGSDANRAPAGGAAGQLWLDVVAAAFACNASRIGVYGFGDTSAFSSYSGSDWHQDVAHQWYLDAPQGWLTQSYQGVFEQLMVYLAAKLDQLDDGNGQTVLDNSLLVWSQECCMETHMSYGLQTVTFGGAAGAMNTGLLCDYRNLAASAAVIRPAKDAGTTTSTNPAFSGYATNPGVLWEQWLATELQLMGVAPAEFELWRDASGNVQHGYGTPYVGTDLTFPSYYQGVSSPYFQIASTPLPFLKK